MLATRAFVLNREDGTSRPYKLGDEIEPQDRDHWMAKGEAPQGSPNARAVDGGDDPRLWAVNDRLASVERAFTSFATGMRERVEAMVAGFQAAHDDHKAALADLQARVDAMSTPASDAPASEGDTDKPPPADPAVAAAKAEEANVTATAKAKTAKA